MAQTWTGNGSNDFWTTQANWQGGTAPVPGETTNIAFGGTTRRTPSNNFTAFRDFRNVTFNAGAGSFVVGGNAINLLGRIRNNSTVTQRVDFTIGTGSLSSSFIELDPASGDLIVGGAQVLLGNNQLRVPANGGRSLTFGTGTVISGDAGSFLLDGNTTVVFRSAHTYGGGTVINAGTLSIGDGTTNGIPAGNYQINSGGILRMKYNAAGVTSAWTSAIWNNFTGDGILALTTAKNSDDWGEAALPNAFSGTLQIERGRVGTQIGAGYGIGGAKAIKVWDGGQLMDLWGSAITQDLTIAGSGYGEGALECSLRLAEYETVSNLSGRVDLSASATIAARGRGILSNTISGNAGSALNFGTWYCKGTIILNGANTYAGNTTISYGTLQIGNGGTTGTLGGGTITNNGTLAFKRSDAVSVPGITGSGALRQSGSGTLTLAAANTYSGATTISSGRLAMGLDAALPGSSAMSMGSATLDAATHTNSAGTLQITGAATIDFDSGGKLAFANSSSLAWTGELRVTGDFISGVSLRFGTDNTGLSSNQLQRIRVTGFAGCALDAHGYLTTATPIAQFNAWQSANLTSQNMGEDLDQDGVQNGIEYFLHGAADSSGSDMLPGVTDNAGSAGVTWTKASSYNGVYGTDYVVQTSSTLLPGSWVNQPPSANMILSGNDVRYNFPAGFRNFARLVMPAPLQVDTSAAIPLRGHIYRNNQFALSLRGSAIQGTTPYEANFDTGSWETCLPYGALNKANLTVLQTHIRTGWGVLADKVSGQFTLLGRDGVTSYTVDNFIFYAMRNEDGSEMADDRTQPWSGAIIGAFPTLDSLPIVLARKYSNNGLGLGIITESPGGNFVDNWGLAKSYLKFGNDPALAARLNWHYYEPWHQGQVEFDPIVHPGFKVTFSFPETDGQTFADIVVPDLIATIDTGAPDLTMRLGPDDPHRQPPYSRFFNSAAVPWWYSAADCQAMNHGVNVRIDFTGSFGRTDSYSFPTANTNGAYVPNPVYIGDWDSGVPWAPYTPALPRNRINLGNSIYFFCKVHFWDFTNQRVGYYFD